MSEGAELLELWERASVAHPVERALLLAAHALPELERGSVATLPIGERDRLVMATREHLFGDELTLLARCPRCGEELEWHVSATALGYDASAPLPARGWYEVAGAERTLWVRVPNSDDLHALLCADGSDPATFLLARCTRVAEGEEAGPLTTDEIQAVSAAMALADPLGEVATTLDCPACAHRWRAIFDPASLVWAELDNAAFHLLLDVHALAAAYHWSEHDILAMTPARRQTYLRLVGR